MEKENVNEVQRRKSARLSKFSGSLKEDDQGAAEKSEEEEDKFTFINYKGDIKYFTDYYQIAMACDDITKWLDKQTDAKVVPVSFDMEWPFSFQTGPGKTSVIQICVEEDCCYVFQLTNIKKLPAALVGMLKHPKALMHGVNIKNDFRKLARDFPEVNADELINKSIDLGVWCNTVCETGGRWSLDRLAKFIVKKAVDKNKKVRMSKWHIVPLNETQLLYAAIDVYIGQLIYRELDKRAQAKEKNETDYKEQHGEEAFKALKSLGQNFITPPVALEETNKDTKSEANPDLLQ